MEASLIVVAELENSEKQNFLHMMINDGYNKPLLEEDVEIDRREWFNILEEFPESDYVQVGNANDIYASWTLGGADLNEEAAAIVSVLRKYGVLGIAALLANDEGGYQLFIGNSEKCDMVRSWRGKNLNQLFDGVNNIYKVLSEMVKSI